MDALVAADFSTTDGKIAEGSEVYAIMLLGSYNNANSWTQM